MIFGCACLEALSDPSKSACNFRAKRPRLLKAIDIIFQGVFVQVASMELVFLDEDGRQLMVNLVTK